VVLSDAPSNGHTKPEVRFNDVENRGGIDAEQALQGVAVDAPGRELVSQADS